MWASAIWSGSRVRAWASSARATPIAPPNQQAATPMPPQLKPDLVRYQPVSPTAAAGTSSRWIGPLVTSLSPRANQAPGSDPHSSFVEVDSEQSTSGWGVRRDERGVEHASQRAPRLRSGKPPFSAGCGGRVQTDAGGLRREDAPRSTASRRAGLTQDRSRIEMRLGHARGGQIDRAQGRQQPPELECLALAGEGDIVQTAGELDGAGSVPLHAGGFCEQIVVAIELRRRSELNSDSGDLAGAHTPTLGGACELRAPHRDPTGVTQSSRWA